MRNYDITYDSYIELDTNSDIDSDNNTKTKDMKNMSKFLKYWTFDLSSKGGVYEKSRDRL